MEFVLLSSVIIGLTELIKRIRARDLWTVITIVSSALVGVLFGLFGIEGLNVVNGLVAGLAATGVVTGLGAIGTRSVPTTTTAVK